MDEEKTETLPVVGENKEELPAQVPAGSSALLDPRALDALKWWAKRYSESALVPAHFQGKVSDCAIAIHIAHRLNVDPLALMQSTYIVHGRPGFEAKFVAGLVNNSGLLVGRIHYRTEGEDPKDRNYRVQAYGKDRETEAEITGPWITWDLVRGEGWDSKAGSKWKTMPEQMFHYRAAAWFARRHFPDLMLGMYTKDELEDMGQAEVVGVRTSDRAAALLDVLASSGGEKPEEEHREPDLPMFEDDEPAAEPTNGEHLFLLRQGLDRLKATEGEEKEFLRHCKDTGEAAKILKGFKNHASFVAWLELKIVKENKRIDRDLGI